MATETKKKSVTEVPQWAHEIKRKYLSQNVSQFVVHGNINDYVRVSRDGEAHYVRLREFYDQEMFKHRDIVVFYDRAAGIRFKDDRIFGGEGLMRQDFVSTLKMFDELTGNNFSDLSREPARAFLVLDTYFNLCINQEFLQFLISYLERRLKQEAGETTQATAAEEEMDIVQRFMQKTIPDLMSYIDQSGEKGKKQSKQDISKLLKHLKSRVSKPKSIAFVVEYAETIIPQTGNSKEERMLLVFLQKWAREDKFLQADMTVVIQTENITSLNPQYIRNPYTFEVNIPYPDEHERLQFIEQFLKEHPEGEKLFEMEARILARNTAGLGIVHLKILMAEVIQNQLTFTNKELTQKKKEMIESEAGGMLEFVTSKFSLKDVAGHKQAKKHLMDAARALKAGRHDVMPMGYLVAGPVGTGKTFMITTFTNDIGVPMVILKNFRGQYVGQSEGNLQKVLKILKAMSPVAVMIDEADAYLGNRSGGGDSGVSQRIFSMIATFMSNTENRGKVIWFLVTARPDLMPVDFKRQGRAEEHIGLFYPETLAEKKELLEVMMKKTGIDYLEMDEFDEEFFEDLPVRSGADMEAALTRAKFKAASLGLDNVTFDLIAQVFNDFLPPTYPEEIELMNYSAVLECTSKELLPPRFRELSRAEVLERIQELKESIRLR
ncbi:MAG: AAA family ATPase [Bacteroidota bacterium]